MLADGAINLPAVLLCSYAPDPHGQLGTRTFLHPAVMSSSAFDKKVENWNGAPQTAYSDHFFETQLINENIGYKIEALSLHAVIFASLVPGTGVAQHKLLSGSPQTHTLLARLRHGFHEQSPGGEVKRRDDDSGALHYSMTDYVLQGWRRALLSRWKSGSSAAPKTRCRCMKWSGSTPPGPKRVMPLTPCRCSRA